MKVKAREKKDREAEVVAKKKMEKEKEEVVKKKERTRMDRKEREIRKRNQ